MELKDPKATFLADSPVKGGIVDARLLYESPFTDIAPQGRTGLFVGTQVSKLIAALEAVNCTWRNILYVRQPS